VTGPGTPQQPGAVWAISRTTPAAWNAPSSSPGRPRATLPASTLGVACSATLTAGGKSAPGHTGDPKRWPSRSAPAS